MVDPVEYIGRFAPTPSGPLHFGSLVTAVGSYLDARAHGGQWLLRIEDVDRPRVVPGAADDILATLERFGLLWDGPVLYQSERADAYEAVLQQLQQQGLLYACSCSRRQLIEAGVERGPLGLIYPGHCRDRGLSFEGHSQRLRVERKHPVRFDDRHAGKRIMDVQRRIGDVVLKRIDGIHAYHLAVVVDDAFQGITDIVRGADLLEVSFIHLHIASLLDHPLPRYLHLPLVYAASGRKLSKQTGAQALDTTRPGEQLWQALEFLGQQPETALKQGRPQEILQWGIAHWQPQRLPGIEAKEIRA